jgi:hypothetical protein
MGAAVRSAPRNALVFSMLVDMVRSLQWPMKKVSTMAKKRASLGYVVYLREQFGASAVQRHPRWSLLQGSSPPKPDIT